MGKDIEVLFGLKSKKEPRANSYASRGQSGPSRALLQLQLQLQLPACAIWPSHLALKHWPRDMGHHTLPLQERKDELF